MKKSNKLLLGAFLTVILTITGIHIALYAKYKSGDYTIYHRKVKEEDDRMQKFPGVSFVIVRNVGTAMVVFGDTAAVEKSNVNLIKYEQKGDSLFITGHNNKNNIQLGDRFQVNIILPSNVSIETDSVSSIFLQSKEFIKTKITTIPNNP
jgi:hypothetical protein